MSCTNCFSGCVDTTSDKCVKYTGDPIDFLNIHTGDSLEVVEQSITEYLASVFNGLGIFPTIQSSYICDIVKQYFPCEECGSPTLVGVLTAIIRAVCDIEAEVVVERERIDTIEDTYTVDCLTVDPDAGTHAVLEAVITALCIAIDDIETLNDLFATCITTSTIDTYIKNYLNTIIVDNKMYTKMVPYVIYPFYPTPTILNSFSNTGAGLGTWEKVYFCNGQNGTPDLRGRSLIGVVSPMRAGSYDREIDPTSGNKDYAIGDKNGVNEITLAASQIAKHTHTATPIVTDPGHITTNPLEFDACDVSVPLGKGCAYPILHINGQGGHYDCNVDNFSIGATTTKDLTGITVAVTNAENSEGGNAHSNVHPVYAVYYIIYLP